MEIAVSDATGRTDQGAVDPEFGLDCLGRGLYVNEMPTMGDA